MAKGPPAHPEVRHYVNRSGWLRAAVLGANDGIVSVSALIVGVAAADPSASTVFLAGFSGLAAGALSMAAGEFVSVSSQADIEKADMLREIKAIEANPESEIAELAHIYEERGLSPDTARKVALELTEHDALGAHMRDELGLSEVHSARPFQAAFASGMTFSVAAAVPLLAAVVAPQGWIIPVVLVVTLFALAVLGALGAIAGGAPKFRAIVRVVCWGVFAMAITSLLGTLFGVVV
ncbi:VIT family protein [Lentibacter sp. XHP0401]|jgi:vacuolar iron transporter family protein|uniref:VIT1/CCC1 transporter family protein n=1 Tax=Lentibacter sp. XHP0401 TaxID=2984334 RepID=UPI0021E8DB46|nr:VIT family protein [Lentibacter sp. XHP0401]MCV2892476.1 VIT family protein [Lentibacter sp. XHP0401]